MPQRQLRHHPEMDEQTLPCFPQPPDNAISVWRYLDLWKFIDLLNTRELYLSRVDKLDDPHEGSITRPQHVGFRMDEFLADVPLSPSPEQRARYRQELRKRTYVSCWHVNQHESEAMWRLYSNAAQGIAIRTTYEKLSNSLSDPDMYIGLITYKDFEKEAFCLLWLESHWPINYGDFAPFMHKRLAFQHEREVRIIKMTDEAIDENWEAGIRLDWDLSQIIDGIYVNPYAQDCYYNVVQAVVQKFAPELKGMVEWSRMKGEPLY